MAAPTTSELSSTAEAHSTRVVSAMEGASAEGPVSESQIPSQLRQRMLNRAATFAEGAQSSPTRPLRRRSSLLSELSDTRHSTRSSTENRNTDAYVRATASEDGNNWLSSPVIFAIFPAFGGLLYQNGAAVLTDLFTLGLASWFLHWCCTFPWTWYHLAQQRQYIEPDEQFDDIIEEEDEVIVNRPDDVPDLPEDDSRPKERDDVATATEAQLEASQALKTQERLAFAACFVGPLIGACLLHTIRGQLKVTEGLVSDYNLTIFVMVAELRPIARLMKMQEEHMFHLQRIVKTDPQDLLNPNDAQAIALRLSELEGRLSGPMENNDLETSRVAAEVQQGLQKQLDAITRAIRRYEKRSASQTMQIEARFQEVDLRLRDALSLAAAAARTGQRPGIIASVFSWLINLVNNSLQIAWDVALYPFRTVLAVAVEVKSYFVKDEERQSRRRLRFYTMSLQSDLNIDASKFDRKLADKQTEEFNEKLIKIWADGPRWYEVGAVEYRKLRWEGKTPLPKPVVLPEGINGTIPSREAGREIPYRVFKPAGGDRYLKYMADHYELTVFSVGYRLAPEHPWPAGGEDCYDAAEWLVKNGPSAFGGELMFTGGEVRSPPPLQHATHHPQSAGGHLACLVAFHLLETTPAFAFRGLLLHFGCYDLSGFLPHVAHHEKHLVIDHDVMTAYLNALLPNTTIEQRRHPSISPFFKDIRGLKLPPALFTCGSEDPLLDDTVFMGAKWQMWGNEAVVKIYNGAPHGFIMNPPGTIRSVEEGLQDSVAFVRARVGV
ncbi:hypothetical protein OPT61_g9710 [Boeremia exigua]|uniref:Uncharacterized protein n=1 Tax=Boeremia exigua TaxID=749465 RepID=A0ACC2HT45_9PLEO|nr:hypothetical protein OPT61_g9710 [Boeremia exigua]